MTILYLNLIFFSIFNLIFISFKGQYHTLEDCLEVLNSVQVIFEGIRVQDPKLPTFVREIETIKGNCSHIFMQCQMLDTSLSIVER